MAAILSASQNGRVIGYSYRGFLQAVQARTNELLTLSSRVAGPMQRVIARRIAHLQGLATVSETQFRSNRDMYIRQLRALGGGIPLPNSNHPPVGPVAPPAVPTAGFGAFVAEPGQAASMDRNALHGLGDHGVDGLGSIAGDAVDRVTNLFGVTMMVGAVYLSIRRHRAIKLWPTLGAVFFPEIALPYQAAMTVLKK